MDVRDDNLPAGLQEQINMKQKDMDSKSRGNYMCYPLNLSKTIKWAQDVEDLKPIQPKHDWVMLDRLGL